MTKRRPSFCSVACACPRLALLFIRNSFPRSPQAQHAYHNTREEEAHVERKLDRLSLGLEPRTLVHPQPEDTRQAVGEPADEEGGNEAEQAVEDGDGFGNDHSEEPDPKGDADPDNGR